MYVTIVLSTLGVLLQMGIIWTVYKWLSGVPAFLILTFSTLLLLVLSYTTIQVYQK